MSKTQYELVPSSSGILPQLEALSYRAFTDLRIKFRGSHLHHWQQIAESHDASEGEKERMQRNLDAAVESATTGLPYCQDTGTDVAYVYVGPGESIPSKTDLHAALQRGATKARQDHPYRSSIFVPTAGFGEGNSGDNTPLELHIFPSDEPGITGIFGCKGGGSGSKIWSFSEKPLLASDRKRLIEFLITKIKHLGHSACPPYHLSVVLGGLSHMDNSQLLTRLTVDDTTPFDQPKVLRDEDLEADIAGIIKQSDMGAQGRGKYFLMPDGVRVLRAPRHAAHFFIGIGVSCSAHRVQRFRVVGGTAEIEVLESQPQKYMPAVTAETKQKQELVHIDANDREDALAQMRRMQAGDRFLYSGPILGGRDKAHARWMMGYEADGRIPAYLKQHVGVLYVGPADTPAGEVIGSFGPTTASRMDGFAEFLQGNNLIPLSVGKGNRSAGFAETCGQHSGLYAVLQGGPASILRKYITSVDILDYEDLGMEAVRLYTLDRMPMQLVVDAHGNDLYASISNTVKTS